MRILLTNDDSGDSPLLDLAMACLRPHGDVTAVVPREEQSWKAKSMTRFGDLVAEPHWREGGEVWTLNGTPADCVNLGVYHLYAEKPDLVVAGVNIGVNVGLGFTISSGTVGACLEGNIAGVPAVALSQEMEGEVFHLWGRTRRFPHERVGYLWTQLPEIVDRLFGKLSRKRFLAEPVTWNVNVPAHTREGWQLAPTVAGRSFYGSCFEKAGEVYRHNVATPTLDMTEGSDIRALSDGDVSVTRIDIRTFCQETFTWKEGA